MTTFDDRIRAIEQEITDLKSISRKASSVLTTTAQEITVNPTIKGYTIIPGGTKSARAKTAIVAEITLDQPGFVSVSIVTDSDQRQFSLAMQGSTDSNPQARIWCYGASAADIAELNGSGTKTIPITIRITATANFTITTSEEPA